MDVIKEIDDLIKRAGASNVNPALVAHALMLVACLMTKHCYKGEDDWEDHFIDMLTCAINEIKNI